MPGGHSTSEERINRMKIKLTSVSIADYDKALKFYTEVLGFVKSEISHWAGALGG